MEYSEALHLCTSAPIFTECIVHSGCLTWFFLHFSYAVNFISKYNLIMLSVN